MSRTNLEARRQRYFQLNTQLAQLDNNQINQLFNENDQTRGWGVNHIIELAGTKVFVKKIPLTNLEHQNLFSTKNLYELPTFYNYGVGSAGFGAFRELVTHIKTTNWVLAGEIENFPIMYHYRIMPRIEENPPLDEERYERYVKYWNNDQNIKRFGLERRNAQFEIVLFLEYFPHNVWDWFGTHLDKSDQLLDDMRQATLFLQKNGIIHFDVHFGNIVTDETQFYLTDFGLALDKAFDLDREEQSFFNRNDHYDFGELIYSFAYHLAIMFENLSASKRETIASKIDLPKDVERRERLVHLLANLDVLAAKDMMSLNKAYVDLLKKYQSINRLIDTFFEGMGKNNKKDTKFDNEQLKTLLEVVGFFD